MDKSVAMMADAIREMVALFNREGSHMEVNDTEWGKAAAKCKDALEAYLAEGRRQDEAAKAKPKHSFGPSVSKPRVKSASKGVRLM